MVFLGIPWAEWLGYAASLVVAVSLLMKSLIRLRWINLGGSILFAAYGFLIGAWPVAGFNVAIIFINIGYLVRMYHTRETFELLETDPENPLYRMFLEQYRTDIAHFFPAFQDAVPSHILRPQHQSAPGTHFLSFFILRDLFPAGLLLGLIKEEGILDVQLDYVTPAYRDFKTGHFLFETSLDTWRTKGIRQLRSKAFTPRHADYLLRMGFASEGELYVKTLV